MVTALTQQDLEAAHCWEAEDRVPGRPEMTEFRRRLRYHQSQWREAQGHPIGSQPIAPRPDGGPARLVGSEPMTDSVTGATVRPMPIPYTSRTPNQSANDDMIVFEA